METKANITPVNAWMLDLEDSQEPVMWIDPLDGRIILLLISSME
jgi:hypothetical protein